MIYTDFPMIEEYATPLIETLYKRPVLQFLLFGQL
jgi:hypothetical protein